MGDQSEWQRLQVAATAQGAPLTEQQALDLLRYRDLLLLENAQVNLTGVRDPEEAFGRVLLDSLAFGLHLNDSEPLPSGSSIADLGSGGGVPGLVIAIAFPHLQVHLVESRKRKSEALLRLRDACGLKDRVTVHGQRLSTLLPFQNTFAAITARAVAALNVLLKEARPFLQAGSGTLVAWKSNPVDAKELALGDKTAERLGFLALEPLPYQSFKPCTLLRYRRIQL
jgi:16S rRNA (guanine527-N7)-methyltransferase